MSATRDDVCVKANALLKQLAADQEKCSQIAIAYSKPYSPLHFTQADAGQVLSKEEHQAKAKEAMKEQLKALQREMDEIRQKIKAYDEALGLHIDPKDPNFMNERHI